MSQVLKPKYFDEFQCIGSACGDSCCFSNWNVLVDKETYQKYEHLPDSEIRNKIQQAVSRNPQATDQWNYGKIKVNSTTGCSLLDENGWCNIHKELGADFLCNTCYSYPRHIHEVGAVIEKSLMLSCPEATKLILMRPEGIDFMLEDEGKVRGVMQSYDLTYQPYFEDIRAFTIQLLQDRRYAFDVRLILVGMFIQAFEAIEESEKEQQVPLLINDFLNRLENKAYIQAIENLQGNALYHLEVFANIIGLRKSFTIESAYYQEILQQIEQSFAEYQGTTEEILQKYNTAKANYYDTWFAEHDYVLENYAVNYVFRRLFPYHFDTPTISYNMLVLSLSLLKMHIILLAQQTQKLDTEMVLHCIQQVDKMYEHNDQLLALLSKQLPNLNLTDYPHIYLLIKS